MDEYGAFKRYKSLKQIRGEHFKIKIGGEFWREASYDEIYDLKCSGILRLTDFTRPARKKFEYLKDEYKRIFYSQKHKRIMRGDENGKRIQ